MNTPEITFDTHDFNRLSLAIIAVISLIVGFYTLTSVISGLFIAESIIPKIKEYRKK